MYAECKDVSVGTLPTPTLNAEQALQLMRVLQQQFHDAHREIQEITSQFLDI
jgi:hypothetical protein